MKFLWSSSKPHQKKPEHHSFPLTYQSSCLAYQFPLSFDTRSLHSTASSKGWSAWLPLSELLWCCWRDWFGEWFRRSLRRWACVIIGQAKTWGWKVRIASKTTHVSCIWDHFVSIWWFLQVFPVCCFWILSTSSLVSGATACAELSYVSSRPRIQWVMRLRFCCPRSALSELLAASTTHNSRLTPTLFLVIASFYR